MASLADLKFDSILSLPVRFDRGEIRRAHLTEEGYLHSDAIYRRDGVLTYRTPTGIRKELSLPEANQDAVQDFGFKPFTIEHPPVLLDSRNARKYAQGITDSTTYYDPKAGFVRGVVCVFDSDAIETIQKKEAFEISAGYQCRTREEPGTWRGEHYDAIQEVIRPNHVAGTRRGRAGPDVSFRGLFDSLNSQQFDVGYEDPDATDTQYFIFPTSKSRKDSKKRMASITRNGITFDDVPQDLAVFVTQEFNKLDSDLAEALDYIPKLEEGANTDSQTLQELREALAQKEEEATYQMGRADELEVMVTNADSILTDMGYRKDSAGDYYRTDGKKEKKMPPWLEEDDEEEEIDGVEAEADEEELPLTTKKKKHMGKAHAKKDSDDSVAARFKAWRELEKVSPGVMDSDRFDDGLDVDAINALRIDAMKEAIAQAKPEQSLEGRNDSYVEGIYEGLMLTGQPQQSRVDHTDNFEAMLATAARTGSQSPWDKLQQEAMGGNPEPWKAPLSSSVRK